MSSLFSGLLLPNVNIGVTHLKCSFKEVLKFTTRGSTKVMIYEPRFAFLSIFVVN